MAPPAGARFRAFVGVPMALSGGLLSIARRGEGTAFGSGEICSSGERRRAEISSEFCAGVVGVAVPFPVEGVAPVREVG